MLNRQFLALLLAIVAAAWGDSALATGRTNVPPSGRVNAPAASRTNAPPAPAAPLPPRIAYLPAEQEAQTFFCQDGYRMELVLSDPIIREPVLTVFDGNGRMFVAEMRSYMQDIDGNNER